MTERGYRLLVGVWLLAASLYAQPILIYALMGMQVFEGLTNWRLTILLSRLRRRMELVPVPPEHDCLIPLEAERAFRLTITAMLGVSVILIPDMLWWMPWFIAFAMIGAGLSGICPMVVALRWVGMR